MAQRHLQKIPGATILANIFSYMSSVHIPCIDVFDHVWHDLWSDGSCEAMKRCQVFQNAC